MTAPEKSLQGFLQRWSRRKRAGAERAEQPVTPGKIESPQGARSETPAIERCDEAVDSSSAPAKPPPAGAENLELPKLPALDSINAATDVRAFLAPGVPVEAARAALRRAWVSDPTIRDFIGLAENQWDFTDPKGVPGFGSLDVTPALRRTITELFSKAAADESGSVGNTGDHNIGKTTPPDLGATTIPSDFSETPGVGENADLKDVRSRAATQHPDAAAPVSIAAARKHGGALPE